MESGEEKIRKNAEQDDEKYEKKYGTAKEKTMQKIRNHMKENKGKYGSRC